MKERWVDPCLQLTCSLPAPTGQSDHSTATTTKGLGRPPLGSVQKDRNYHVSSHPLITQDVIIATAYYIIMTTLSLEAWSLAHSGLFSP